MVIGDLLKCKATDFKEINIADTSGSKTGIGREPCGVPAGLHSGSAYLGSAALRVEVEPSSQLDLAVE
ncbi:Lon protease-like protein, mitochondrial [Frankliniella fusca]|uniref:Lon protease-like protein, mitochondrial n=1 Tax=Frankliniella fusca TaxID=407009 RepID=A0AAE1LEC8_9NEOP|nr:Lon protease-like protein, mitochondrial [Frankliniella fusca]